MNSKCTKCNSQISATDKFCQSCGAAVVFSDTSGQNNNQMSGFGTGGYNPQQGGGYNNQMSGFGAGGYNPPQGGFGVPTNGQPNGFNGTVSGNTYINQGNYSQDEKMQKYAFISSFFDPTDIKFQEQLVNYLEGRRCKFNWAAAFFAGPWMAYRKMNLKAYLYTLLMSLVTALVAIVVVSVMFANLIQYMFIGNMDEDVLAVAAIAMLAVLFGFFLYFGLCGYKIYFNRLSKLFDSYRNVDRNYMPVLHNKYGGTSPLYLIIYIAIMIILNYMTN